VATNLPRAEVSSEQSGKPQPTRFVARQPIFDRTLRVIGYELLFRDGITNHFTASDVDAACRTTLDSSWLMGLDVLCAGALAFVNCTREALLAGYPTLLPPHATVVEILENVSPAPEIFYVCRDLKRAGYLIALDDFVPNDSREPLVQVVDMIKLELPATPRKYWRQLVDRYEKQGVRMLAEKVETHDEFLATQDAGFTYFQGYFFQQPVTLSTTEVPASEFNYLRMLQAAFRPVLDWDVLESLVKQEPSLCYRLLRYLNSPAFGLLNEIRSVRHALTILGEREIRKWISVVATLAMGSRKPGELVQTALLRGHFCELISRQLHQRTSDAFLLGLLSLMDAILGVPLSEVLRRVSVDNKIKEALLHEPSPLLPVYELVLAHENANWEECRRIAEGLKLQEAELGELYLESIQWAGTVMRS
jgi:EAL and modified HD-GYP domain-containing signal transduction protein